jgi:hypothetical protein
MLRNQARVSTMAEVWCIDQRYSDFPARNASANMHSNAHWIFNQFRRYQPRPG